MFFDKNQFKVSIHNVMFKEIKKEFPEISHDDSKYTLSTYKFIKNSPECYYSKEAFELYLNFLTSHKEELIPHLIKLNSELDLALKVLNKINEKDIHEQVLSSDIYKLMSFIDKHLHYNYLKLLETSFYYLMLLPARISRIKRKKPILKLDLFNVVEELQDSSFDEIIQICNNTLRNGIAHGKITFTDEDIIYKDKKGNTEQISAKYFVSQFDKLVNITNGLCLALQFFCSEQTEFLSKNNFKVPFSILTSELKARMDISAWEILDCLDSVASRDDTKQLTIFVKTNLRDYSKIQFLVIQTAYWLEKLTHVYDRFFFRIESKHTIDGAGAIDVKTLREGISLNDEYKIINSLENGYVMVFSNFKLPKLIYKVGSLSLITKSVLHEIKYNLAKSEYNFIIRDVYVHSRKTHLVVELRQL